MIIRTTRDDGIGNQLLSEISDNIVDHSRAEYGWISFQYYPQMCIADAGIGLLQSYKK